MAKSMIDIDSRQLKKWGDYTKLKRPSQAIAIIRGVLNDQAFYARKAAREKTMPNLFNIRSQWAISSVLVNKAQGKDPKKMYSETGAAKRWGKNKKYDFMGLKYQELGHIMYSPWIHTAESRGGSFPGKVPKKYRRAALNNAYDINESSYGRLIGAIRKLDKQKHKGFVRIKRRNRSFKKGIYVFGKAHTYKDKKQHRSLRQVVDLSQGTVRTPRRPWLSKAAKMVTQQKTMRFFKRQWDKFTTERKK